MKKLICVLVLFALAIPAMAADASGKWAATMPGPEGDFSLLFDLKADSEMLTGSTSNDFTGEVAIANGKVTGDTIAFDVTYDFDGNAVLFHYTGKVGMEAIEFTQTAAIEGPWPPVSTFTAKKM